MMQRVVTAAIAAAFLVLAQGAEAQAPRIGTLPARKAPPADVVPMIVLRDGSVMADLGRGYERLVRSCAAYASHRWPAGHASAPIEDIAPQGGSASRPPNADGLPAAPGLSAPPGLSPAPGRAPAAGARSSVGLSRPGSPAVGRATTAAAVGRSAATSGGGSSSTTGTTAPGSTGPGTTAPGTTGNLAPMHSGWRTAGPLYHDGTCYTRDHHGRLRLIRL